MINDNDIINTDMNETLKNVDVTSLIGLVTCHNLSQANKSRKPNETNMSVKDGDVNTDYCYINGSSVSAINNHNFIGYTKKWNGISTKRFLSKNNGLPVCVYFDDILPEFAPHQYITI